ncbi:MAG TPA: O-antigen ligase [Phenylobacterium sp.]|nr:O-antigen ligase [Phenylobacterium sp.]
MTAWADATAQARPPVTLRRAATFAASVLIVLVFSQAWVFPLLGEKGDPSASGLVRMLFLPAYAAAFVLLALSPVRATLATLRQPFLLLLMLIVGASVLWSVAPDQTVRRTVAIYATTLGGVVLGARYRWAELAEVLGTAFAILAVIALAVSVAVPSIGVMHELFPGAWRGPWPEKNQLGGNMGLGFCILAAAALLNPGRARLWWPFAALALGLILMSTSKTSLVAVMLGMGGLVFIALVRRGPAMGVVTTWLAVLGLVMLGGFALFASDLFFEILGKDATLTGRTRIWAAIMRRIAERPWTGYGYGAVWNETGAWGPLAWIVKDAGFKPQHAHNAWLEQWLGLGLGGLIAFVLMYLQAAGTAVVAVYRHKGAYLALPFLIVYSLMSLTESVAVTYNDFRWVIFVAIAVKLAWPDRELPA